MPLATTDLFSITLVLLFKKWESYRMWPFEAGFSHSAQCLRDSSMLPRVLIVCSFLLLYGVPLYNINMPPFVISSSTEGDLGAHSFWLSQMLLLWTLVYRLSPYWFYPTRKIWWDQWKPRDWKIKCPLGQRFLPLREAVKIYLSQTLARQGLRETRKGVLSVVWEWRRQETFAHRLFWSGCLLCQK